MLEAAENESNRPPFMAALGLLPPYEEADVKEAYRAKVFVAHPDRGGDPAEFVRLTQAYEQALEYVAFRGSRRAWIAAKVEQHLQQEEVVEEVLRRGGRVEVERFPWMEKSWGDGFPVLAERVRHVVVRDMEDGDTFLAFLADHPLPYLIGLDVAGSRVSADGLRHLASYELMRWLDVSGTNVDYPALSALLLRLPELEWLNVRKTRVGWWGRWQLRRGRRRLRVVAEVSPAVKPGSEALDEDAWTWPAR